MKLQNVRTWMTVFTSKYFGHHLLNFLVQLCNNLIVRNCRTERGTWHINIPTMVVVVCLWPNLSILYVFTHLFEFHACSDERMLWGFGTPSDMVPRISLSPVIRYPRNIISPYYHITGDLVPISPHCHQVPYQPVIWLLQVLTPRSRVIPISPGCPPIEDIVAVLWFRVPCHHIFWFMVLQRLLGTISPAQVY